MNSEITQPFLYARQSNQKPIDIIISLHEQYQISILYAVQRLPLLLVVAPVATLLLHLVDYHLLDDVSYIFYILYLPFILWTHVMILFRKYYSNTANLELHVLTSENIKQRYLCQQQDANQLYSYLNYEIITLFIILHLLLGCLEDIHIFFLLISDVFCLFYCFKHLGKANKIRKKLFSYYWQCNTKNIYTITPQIGQKRAQLFQQNNQFSYFQPNRDNNEGDTPQSSKQLIQLKQRINSPFNSQQS